jgi:hypothetical protein
MSKYHAVSSGMVTRQALPSITRQRGATTGSANLMLYGAGKTTATNNTTFIDSSANAFTITNNASTAQSGYNPFSQASSGAGYFNSASSNYLQTPTNTALNLSSGNYTVEGWYYLDMATYSSFDLIGRGIVSDYLTNSSGRWFVSINGSGKLTFTEQDAIGANSVEISDPSNSPLQQWVYFAAVKSGTTMYLFNNGTLVASATSSVRTGFPGRLNVGQTTVDTNYRGFFLGYISNLRVVKGTAVYTSNFTPPTSPLTAITNTSLLLLTDNYRVVNSSPTSYPITNTGTNPPVISTAQFPTGMSSSIYFDGTGACQTPAAAALAFGTGAYTMECWFYQISRTGSNQGLIHPSSVGGIFIMSSGGNIGLWTGAFNLTSIGTSLNTWYHVAVVRQSNSQLNIYINGTSYYQTTNTSNYTSPGQMTFGQDVAYFNGYISNARVCVGTAVYTSNFTVPTAPLPLNINVPAFVTNNIYGLNQIP